jgi:hypothetical protein
VGHSQQGVTISKVGAMMDWILVLVTGAIAYHGLTFRDKNGEREFGHLLFGCIALVFFMRFLFEDLLGWVQF